MESSSKFASGLQEEDSTNFVAHGSAEDLVNKPQYMQKALTEADFKKAGGKTKALLSKAKGLKAKKKTLAEVNRVACLFCCR